MTRVEILHILQSMDRRGVTSKQSEAIDGAIQFLDIGLDGDEASHAYEQGVKDGMADERRRMVAWIKDVAHEISEEEIATKQTDYSVGVGMDKAIRIIYKRLDSMAEPIHPLPFEESEG